MSISAIKAVIEDARARGLVNEADLDALQKAVGQTVDSAEHALLAQLRADVESGKLRASSDFSSTFEFLQSKPTRNSFLKGVKDTVARPYEAFVGPNANAPLIGAVAAVALAPITGIVGIGVGIKNLFRD